MKKTKKGVKVTIKAGAKVKKPKFPKMGRRTVSGTKIKVSKKK